MPPVVAPGIIPRLSKLVVGMKAHKNYSEAIGQHLLLVGSKTTMDPDSWKPVLKHRYNAGSPVIFWKKGRASAIEIRVDIHFQPIARFNMAAEKFLPVGGVQSQSDS